MNPFYQDNLRALYFKDSRDMSELGADSVDLLATDPPYGISFMGKDWDRALPDIRIWQECFRVLKPGAFAFVMSIPRADCLSRMIISLEDTGFRVDFTPIFWTYATGFPKAQNIGKAVDKRLGVERDIVGKIAGMGKQNPEWHGTAQGRKENSFKPEYDATIPTSPQAKDLDGSYGGFQPKPAVEVIIVAMKPLSEKTFVDQALKNGKGITWLDEGRIPVEGSAGVWGTSNKTMTPGFNQSPNQHEYRSSQDPSGRFPANLLVSDDVLNDGRMRQSGTLEREYESNTTQHVYGKWNHRSCQTIGDSGSFSRYFDLDAWFAERIKQLPQAVQKTFPFLIVPKASKGEKEKLLDMPRVVKTGLPLRDGSGDYVENVGGDGSQSTRRTRAKNIHPTVKPIKLMAYLITLGSREGDVVLDNFAGSGTTGVAAALLGRKCIMYEIRQDYCKIAADRCRQMSMELK